jgi:hypothetical protein
VTLSDTWQPGVPAPRSPSSRAPARPAASHASGCALGVRQKEGEKTMGSLISAGLALAMCSAAAGLAAHTPAQFSRALLPGFALAPGVSSARQPGLRSPPPVRARRASVTRQSCVPSRGASPMLESAARPVCTIAVQ